MALTLECRQAQTSAPLWGIPTPPSMEKAEQGLELGCISTGGANDMQR